MLSSACRTRTRFLVAAFSIVLGDAAEAGAQKVPDSAPIVSGGVAPPDAAAPEPSALVYLDFPATPASLGAIADGGAGTGCASAPGPYRNVTFNVSGVVGPVRSVRISLTLNHTWVGDLDVSLMAPGGQTHVIFSRTGATTTPACGDSSNTAGPYSFHDQAGSPPSGGWWQAANVAGDGVAVQSGTYRTTAAGGAGQVNPAPATLMDPVFAGVAPNGTWTLRVRDVSALDTGSITAATLSIGISRATPHDFDGDSKTDFVIERCLPCPPVIVYINRSSDGGTTAIPWGFSSDAFPWVDYDGDGKTDLANWRTGASAVFHTLQSSNGAYAPVAFGTAGDIPYIVGDYDADGRYDYAVFRPSSGIWYALPSTGGLLAQPWGLASDRLTPGDFDGDGRSDFGVKRNGVFHILRSALGYMAVPFGLQSDLVPPGDYDGDGKADLTALRDQSGTLFWYTLRSSDGVFTAVAFGLTSMDFPAPGDYDGDGKMDVAVWRASVGTFYVLRSSNGALMAMPWGMLGDAPMAWFLVR
jgi:subtilisin-like proprotein convertase family protein